RRGQWATALSTRRACAATKREATAGDGVGGDARTRTILRVRSLRRTREPRLRRPLRGRAREAPADQRAARADARAEGARSPPPPPPFPAPIRSDRGSRRSRKWRAS